MSFIDEIVPYIDGNGLVSNTIVPSGVMRASDNGPLFTSQYLILSILNGINYDEKTLNSLLTCIDDKGYLHRAPNDTSEDAPDDHYGVLSLFSLLGQRRTIALPWRCWHPALLYLRYPLLAFLMPVVALIIAFSNMNEDKAATSNKLLTWTLIKGTSHHWLLKLAGKVWTWRMKRIYGSTKAIAAIYFGPTHPFIKYWVE